MSELRPILVVEDNVVNQKVVLLLLGQLGLTADVAENGYKAIELSKRNPYKIILMDCQMPGMDGFEATKAIRKHELTEGKYTPIIAVTALAMVGDRERCIASGMDDYISKPIDREILKIKLNHWMQKEFVLKNQVLLNAVTPAGPKADTEKPINLAELEEFYGSDELGDVLRTFIDSTERLLADIEVAIAEHKDFPLARLAHELKGASASVGAKGLAKLGLYLERAAGMRDWNEARDTYEALKLSFRETRYFLERETQMSLR